MRKPRILIVEDELVVARDIRLQLEALGYTVVGEADTGEQAVDLAAQLQPDLVLMDIQLGRGMDGIAAAQAICAERDLPIVFLTAFSADELLERAKLAQPYGYILKPFTERELRTVLDMALYKHQADAKLRELALHNQTILDNLLHGVICFNEQGLITTGNPSAAVMFGYDAHQLPGCNVFELIPDPHRRQDDNCAQFNQLNATDPRSCHHRETQGQRKDGTTFPLNLTISRITLSGQIAYIGIVRDLSERQQSEEKIQHLAFYDELTGLPNRRRLLDRLQLAASACVRSEQHGALIFLDLDHFRQVNESLGPGFGDDLLREVATRLPLCVRENDTVAHFGGDEFMVMLETLGLHSLAAAAHAETVAHKILLELAKPYSLRGHAHVSSASLGIVMFNQHLTLPDELLKMADVAMYQAKAAGRNTVRFFDPAMQALALARTALEKELKRALVRQEFVLHYQLQVNAEGEPIGVEALVRWQHPDRGLVGPAEFIALAEETGLILQLGQWVLRTACKQLVQWSGQTETADLMVAVNVSALQFAQADFVDGVTQALLQSGARAQRLKLELTESMLLHDVPEVIAKMRAIKALGVSFSLDDFGTGYSSLAYLKRLPLDQLKIDQAFVRDLQTNPDDAVISQTIVSLGQHLGMHVIAEGVETAYQHETLRRMGCNAFQGYYFGRPTAPEELLLKFTKITPLALMA